MLNLISNIRLNRLRVNKSNGFKKDIVNYSNSELEDKMETTSNFSSQTWLSLYR